MKTETYFCDVCSEQTKSGDVFDATLKCTGATYFFHVCSKCWNESGGKGVFKKMYRTFFPKKPVDYSGTESETK